MDKIQLLENFICDEQLKELEQKFEGFNIFDCLRLTRAEIRHSNFLAWLLDPNETHGMNDYFLKEFLKEVLLKKKNEIKKINGIEIELKIPESENKTRKEIYSVPSIFDIDYWDMSNVDVYREYEYIDLLFVDNTNKFVFVIENKIDTAQHDEQLARYREIVDSKYPNDTYKKLYIYLKPQQEEVEKPYIFVDYSIVKAVLEETKKSKADKISSEILMTIEHYNKIIERDIMDKDNIGKICAQIYRKHKTAIDLINKHKGSVKDEIFEIIKSLIENDDSLCLLPSNTDWIRFIPKEANLSSLNIGIKDWVESEKILVFEINNKQDSVDIDIVIRRTDDCNSQKRKVLLEIATERYNYKKGKKKDSYDHVKSYELIKADKYNEIVQMNHNDIMEYLKKNLYNSDIIADFIDFAQEANKKITCI